MSESKGESKGQSSGRPILEIVQSFCTSNDFEGDFESFADENAEDFENVLDFTCEDEHPHVFHNAYRKYLEYFEKKIEKFIKKEGYTAREFYEECKIVLDDPDCPGEDRFFVEALLATSEYDTFFMLMKSEAFKRKGNSLKGEGKGEGKESKYDKE
mmetsp:Transcript_5258/g.5396  ORF Transcript_5258/g.5396 Transcript_5258/m.5396 type:complete len:156 (-) Transcript_5258:227-694(-)|eukprot:CAMPEP_0182417574 /NCGR_PEP_ID=MMETSP1167-20130531/2040_1 /TAXON_ID=2988 /ORGANISM="Mallomonas Sp, Strain CCMP3275" /LENGTH=155 /DNA_ID=CAMNT_0024591237 /DNA_START=126 /DNA_END=593 /DNA_ORIENTATION=+